MKKFIAVIIMFVILISSGAFTLWKLKADMTVETTDFSVSIDTGTAPSAYCMCADGSPMPSEYSNSGYLCIDKNLYGHINHMTYEGEPVYCIGRHTQRSPGSKTIADKCADIPLDSPEYAAVFSAADAGASHNKGIYGLGDYDIYYVTACALRSIIYGISPDSAAFFDSDHNYNEAMTNEYRHILECAQAPVRQTSSEILFNRDDVSSVPVTVDNACYYRYGPYTPQADNSADNTYTASLIESESVCFITSDAAPINAANRTSYNYGDSFYVYINATYTDNISVSVSSQLNTIDYFPVVYLASDSSYQNIARLSVTENTITAETKLSLSNNATYGSLRIIKKFLDNGQEVNNPSLAEEPRFTIQNSDKLYITGTAENGIVTFVSLSPFPVEFALDPESAQLVIRQLPIGEYIIKESHGASGYTAENDTISANNTVFDDEVIFINNAVHEETTVVTSESQTTTVSSSQTQITTASENTTQPSQTSVCVTAPKSSAGSVQLMPGSPKTGHKNCIPSLVCLLISFSVMCFTSKSLKK